MFPPNTSRAGNVKAQIKNIEVATKRYLQVVPSTYLHYIESYGVIMGSSLRYIKVHKIAMR